MVSAIEKVNAKLEPQKAQEITILMEILEDTRSVSARVNLNYYKPVDNNPISKWDVFGLTCWCNPSDPTQVSDFDSCLSCAAQNNMMRQVGPALGAGVGAASTSIAEYADPLGVFGGVELTHILAELESSQYITVLRGEYAKDLLNCINRYPGPDDLQQAQQQFGNTAPN